MKVFELTLESASDRWTSDGDVHRWTKARAAQARIPVIAVEGKPLRGDAVTRTGAVMDAHGRAYYAQTQMAELTRLLAAGEIGSRDVLLFDDLFCPGFSGLPYILSWTAPEHRPRIYGRWHAQTVDPDDFTHTRMFDWMRSWEHMADKCVTGFLVACPSLAEFMRIGGFKAPIYVTGHVFNRDAVRARVVTIKPLAQRSKRIVFTSRWDVEKQPWLFMDLAEKCGPENEGWKFTVLTGAPALRSNDPALLKRARTMQAAGKLTIHEGLSKDAYYALLADSRAHINTARQDWISYTLCEASALGVPSLCPAFRSFPEALGGEPRQLYVPWNLGDMEAKLIGLLRNPNELNISRVADTQHQGLDRVIDIVRGRGHKRWLYEGPDKERQEAARKDAVHPFCYQYAFMNNVFAR